MESSMRLNEAQLKLQTEKMNSIANALTSHNELMLKLLDLPETSLEYQRIDRQCNELWLKATGGNEQSTLNKQEKRTLQEFADSIEI